MSEDRFSGPVFIIGMPRSGKKLLRDLLNRNPRIGLPIHETSFIPYMVDRFGNPPKFDDEREFHRFYEEFTQDPFFQRFKSEGRVLSKEDLDNTVDRTSWHSVYECIIRFYAPGGRAEGFIWGDKSPHYLNSMPLLKEVFPTARFIHSIRDPRDCCLSYKKDWGKSLYRAAESWRERTEAALADSRQMGTDYVQVFYESLLEEPPKVLSNICEYLDCEFTLPMTELTRAPESLGDTGGEVRIVRDNRRKYLTQLSSSQVMRIEEIVCPVATTVGYELDNDVEFKPVKPRMLKALALHDAGASLKFHIKQYGLRQGLGQIFHWHSRGSWVTPHLKSVRRIAGFFGAVVG